MENYGHLCCIIDNVVYAYMYGHNPTHHYPYLLNSKCGMS